MNMKQIKWNGEESTKLVGIKDKKTGLNKLAALYKNKTREVDDYAYEVLVKKHGNKIVLEE